MASFQVRLSDDVHKALKEESKTDKISLADIMRRGFELYLLIRTFGRQGRRFYAKDIDTGEMTEVIILGITRP